MSFELDYIRIRWKQRPDFTGAAFPFGCVYERGVSRPVIRGMVEGRVRALPAAYEILCQDCLTPEDLSLPRDKQRHAVGCLRAPAVPSIHERETAPGGAPALPREMAPAALLADLEQAAQPAGGALDWGPETSAAPAQGVPRQFTPPPEGASLGTVDMKPQRPQQQKGRRA